MMTKTIYKTLFIVSILILTGLKSFPQKAFLFGADATVPQKDTVIIRLKSYVGDIQWQKTLELNGKDNWENIPDANADTLVFIADTTTYFRAQVIAGHCDPYYSDTTFISVFKQNESVFLVNDEVLVLVSDSAQLANGLFVYEGDVSGIDLGSVLVSSVGQGYMRIVTGIQSKGKNSVVLETEQAVLTDVIEEIELLDSLVITFQEDDKRYSKGKPIPVEAFYLIQGAKLKPDKSGLDLSGVNFTIEVQDTTTNYSGSITATITEGHINFSPIFHRELNISWIPPRINRFKLVLGGDIDFEMDVSLEAEVGVSVDKTFSTTLALIGPIPIGPVPMFIKLTLDLSFEAGLSVSGEMTFGFESDYSTSVGASYVRGDSPAWKSLFNSQGSFTPKPVDFSVNANAHAKIGVAPKVAATIAGIAGPYLSIEPYLRADFDVTLPWDWGFAVTAGIDGTLGFEVGILNRILINYSTAIEGPSWTIYEINGEYEHEEPVVETLQVNSITSNSAQSGGNVTEEGTSPVTARGVVWSTSQNPTVTYNQGKTTNGAGIGTFTSNISGLRHATLYYMRAYATSSIGTSYGEQRQFTTLPIAPTLTTKPVTSITASTATSGGNVTSSGGASVTARGVVWSTSQNPTVANNQGVTSNGTGTGNFTSSLTGLAPSTTYYVRAYATNSVGTNYGEQRQFKTIATVPTITTSEITSISATSATTGGNITSSGGANIISCGVVWSTAKNPTVTTNQGITNNGAITGIFTSNISGLTHVTTYYVRAYATNSVGTSYGEQQQFTTLAIAPTVTTNNISSITATSATSGGNITSNGGAAITARGVVWSNNVNPTIESNQGITNNGMAIGAWVSVLDELQPATTYYVRAYATNSIGTSYGEQRQFTTLAVEPAVTTNEVTSITTTSAISGGNITFDGGALVTARGVVWNTTENPTILSNQGITSDGSGTGSWVSELVDLQPGTSYYLRAYATNSVGTNYGEQQQFTTLATVPSITTNEITSITATSATSGGHISSDGGTPVSARGLVWSTTESPTVESNQGITSNGTGTGSFSSNLTGLDVNTTYYVRAYATNSVGISYGNQQSFTTLDGVIVLTTNAVTGITATTATSGGNITSDGGLPITSRGVVWSTEENPTVETNMGITSNGTETGSFTSSLTVLTPETSYNVRAYAVNSMGTFYGQQQSFITLLYGWPTDDVTEVVEVFNPITGKFWMDRNLGASQVATSSTDADAFGDLYQWGRAADGHEKRNSPTTSTLSDSDTPGHGNFILSPSGSNDWRSPENNNLWQGVNGTNNPCPTGYRIPTYVEWDLERISWSSNNSAGAFVSQLKLTLAGNRFYGSGGINAVSTDAWYWTSTANGVYSYGMYFNNTTVNFYIYQRAIGYTIRCIKD